MNSESKQMVKQRLEAIRAKDREPLNSVKKPFWVAFLDGMAALWPKSPRDYLPPTGGGFAADMKSLSGDWRKVGTGLRSAIRHYEQTTADSR